MSDTLVSAVASAADRAVTATPRAPFLRTGAGSLVTDAAAIDLPDWISVPSEQVARALLEAVDVPRGRVLVVDCGTGYLAAAAARVATRVFAIDADASLVEIARRAASALDLPNVSVKRGTVDEGWPEEAPFDAIVVASALDDVPSGLVAQLAEQGVLVAAIGRRRSQQLVRLTRTSAGIARQRLGAIQLAGRLGDLLVENGACARGLVEDAVQLASARGARIGAALAEAGANAVDVHRALALQGGHRFGSTAELLARLDPALARSLPRPFLEHLRAIPIERQGDRAAIATTEPDADFGDLQTALRARELDVHVVTPTDYRRLWSSVDLETSRPTAAAAKCGPRDLLDERDETAHAVALFDALLLDAIAERASDVHVERYGDDVRVRLRIDGDLHDRPRFKLGPDDLRKLVNVVKVSAELDISEQRLPQGGRVRRRAGGQLFDLRVQTQPSLWGEHVVIRLLPQDSRPLAIEDLGFPKALAQEYMRLLESPAGLVLVVGPTGSGKSTTLYAGLQILARDTTRKVISIEDPIEYAVRGIQQSQTRGEIGFHFADAMRAFVREDPDVILVGEIRDGETALEAIRASQTGHVVLSTLHCNDATDAVQRLVDLGMHPNSIASELLAVFAQRLAKRICDGCRTEVPPDPTLLAELFPAGAPQDLRTFAGRGCARCDGRGTRGRIAVVEYLRTGGPIRRAIARRLPSDDLRAAALDAGLVTMRRSGLELVRAGVIALPELRWVLSLDRMAPERPDDPWG